MLHFSGQQDELDVLYDDYVMLYQNQMDLYLKELDVTPKSKRAARHSIKPFWCEELTALWKAFHNAEKGFVKCNKGDISYSVLKRRFLTAQKEFDKELKKRRCSHERSKVYDLEKSNIENPDEF